MQQVPSIGFPCLLYIPRKHAVGSKKHPTCAALLTLVKPHPDRIRLSAVEEDKNPTAMLNT